MFTNEPKLLGDPEVSSFKESECVFQPSLYAPPYSSCKYVTDRFIAVLTSGVQNGAELADTF
jgi:hypothetical protein